jgi:hypothetical protein
MSIPRPFTVKTTWVGQTTPAVLQAGFVGTDLCRCVSIKVRFGNRILTLCRELVEAGFDPESRLRRYRDGILALTGSDDQRADRLEINDRGSGFVLGRGGWVWHRRARFSQPP